MSDTIVANPAVKIINSAGTETKIELLPFNSGSEGYFYWVVINGMKSYRMIVSPTGDCQTFSMNNMDDLMNKLPSTPNWDDNLLKVIGLCKQKANKKQLLINIRKDYDIYGVIKRLFEGKIIVEQEYTSTRDSQMVLFLLNVSHL